MPSPASPSASFQAPRPSPAQTLRSEASIPSLSSAGTTAGPDTTAPSGYGWALNYDKRIYTYPDSSVTPARNAAGRSASSGSAAGYLSSTGETGSLVQNADGSFLYTDKKAGKRNLRPPGQAHQHGRCKRQFTRPHLYRSNPGKLLSLLLANIDQTSPLIVAYDYHLSKIEEKDATDTLTGNKVELHYSAATGRLMDIQDNTAALSATRKTISATSPRLPSRISLRHRHQRHLRLQRLQQQAPLTSIDEGRGVYVNTYDSTGQGRQTDPRRRRQRLLNTLPLPKDQINQHHQRQLRHCPQHPDPHRRVRYQRPAQQSHRHQRQRQGLYQDSNMLLTREEYWENTGSIDTPTLSSKPQPTTPTIPKAMRSPGPIPWATSPLDLPSRVQQSGHRDRKERRRSLQNRVITNTYDSVNGNLLTTNRDRLPRKQHALLLLDHIHL